MRKDHLMILFGVGDMPSKALIGGISRRFPGNVELHICQLKDGVEHGKTITKDDIEGEYAQLIFCKREILDAFIEHLTKIREMWNCNDTKN